MKYEAAKSLSVLDQTCKLKVHLSLIFLCIVLTSNNMVSRAFRIKQALVSLAYVAALFWGRAIVSFTKISNSARLCKTHSRIFYPNWI